LVRVERPRVEADLGAAAVLEGKAGKPAERADVGRVGGRDDVGGQRRGDVAQQALVGVITVNVTVDADTRNLGAAKIDNRVGIGCSLRLL